MNVEYIIVQAGGNGTRLGQFTRNKPKALVPYENLPIIFHLFRHFPAKKFIIIVDYMHDVFEKYLETYAGVSFITVRAEGAGTCAGISSALDIVPGDEPFMLIWSDIILGPDISIDGMEDADHIGISGDFECRWSFANNALEEEPSVANGVAGVFVFQNKKILDKIPPSGEFAAFLARSEIEFRTMSLKGSREIGTLSEMKSAISNQGCRCRPFNRLEITDDTVIKTAVDEQGGKLAVRERAWYREAVRYGFKQIPDIISFEPLTMRRVSGTPVFRAALDDDGKKDVLDKIVISLDALHRLKSAPPDIFSIKEAYYTKTLARLDTVRNIIPFADRKHIVINGKSCHNIYFYRDAFRECTEKFFYDAQFALIHGDCTFSNIMVDENRKITFLDPRGYFGFTELYGDTAYDWAKVFYSIEGDYDQFNNGNFTLDVGEEGVTLEIACSGWKHLGSYYLAKIPGCSVRRIRFIHAVIWLSLTTYAWEDYDSVCGAFYNGLLLMDEFLGLQHDSIL